jgi:Tfp pilus assembly protein PilF
VRGAAAVLLAAALAASAPAQAKRRAPTLKVVGAEPRAIVTVDDVFHGRVDETGARTIVTIPPGRHTVTVRQPGYVDSVHAVVLSSRATATVRPKKTPLSDAAELALQRGEQLALDGRRQEAIEEYRAAIAARGGKYPEAYVGLARVYLALKRFDEAGKAATAATEAAPRSVEAHTVAAHVLRDSGLDEEAVPQYRKAIALAPGASPEAHIGLAIALEHVGDRAEAVAEYRKGIAQNHDVEPIHYQLLGNALERLGQRGEAVQAYERFLALAPEHSLAPAVRSIVEQLQQEAAAPGEEEDVNPYAPPQP